MVVDTGAASTIDRFATEDHGLDNFELESGEMDCGFQIGGILDMDFLRAAGAVIDLGRSTIDVDQESECPTTS